MSNKTQVFINDQLLDLSSDSPIALTFQINDIGTTQNQQGNTSNQFQIPDTQNNRKILGFPNDINFYDPAQQIQLPYTKFRVRVLQNDIEILPNAIMELGDPAYDTNQFNVTILSGNIDFFDQIGGQLADMGDSNSQWSNYGANLVWKPYDHIWNLQNAANSQQKTDGWIYPVVDYGLFNEDWTTPIDVHYMRPGFFIKTAIDLFLKFTNYKAKGTLLNNPLYPLLIAQFSNGSWDHGTDYQNQPDKRGLKAQQLLQTVLDHPDATNPGGNLLWNTITSDPSNQFAGNVIYTANQINSVNIIVTIPHLFLQGYVTPSTNTSNLEIIIYNRDPGYPSVVDSIFTSYIFGFTGFGEKKPGNPAGSDPKGWTRLNGSSGGNLYASIDIYNAIISFQTTIAQGGGVYVGYQWHGRVGSYAYIYPNATFEIKSQNQSVQFGQMVQCERIFPDVSQKDLLKDMLWRFGIICQTDDYSATITFSSLGDIVNNIPTAKDWSSKLINQGVQVSTNPGSYSQINYMEYQVDPNNGLTLIPLKKWWSKIIIKNKTLSAIAQDWVVSMFGGSLNRPYYGDSIAYIQMVDPTDTQKSFSVSVAPRILIDQKLNIGALQRSVRFTDNPTGDLNDPAHNVIINDIISVPYFDKPGGQYSLDWEKLRLLNYPALEKVLNNYKKISDYFLLSAKDIAELNLLVPIYLEQYSSYFYINKVNSWIENVPVKIDLIKLG